MTSQTHFLPAGALGALLLAGAAGAAPGAGTPPTVLSDSVLTPNPNARVPLAARIALTTDEPTQVELTLDDGIRQWTVLAEPEFETAHQVPVLGVRPNRNHLIDVTVIDVDGNRTPASSVSFLTPPLPAAFPPLTTTVSEVDRMEPGVILLATRFNHPNETPSAGSFVMMVDERGGVVWYLESNLNISDANRTPQGTLVMVNGRQHALEMDLFGNVLNEWWATGLGTGGMPAGAAPVATDTFHHEFLPLPESEEADFLVLSSELKRFGPYPTSEMDTSQIDREGWVVGDVIVEMKRDGRIVRQLSLLDVLDPYRLVYDSLGGFWDNTYPVDDTDDWTHANAVILSPDRASYVISMRHQDAVIKVKRQTGELEWILGDPDRWTPPWNQRLLTPVGGPFEWQYHQHAPEFNSEGQLVLFDNGNHRVVPPLVSPPVDEWYSRAVAFSIDEQAMTVEQDWVYGGAHDSFTEPWFSGFLGDADPLPLTKNVLVCDGAKQFPNLNRSWARIVEVTFSRPAVPVFELKIQDPLTTENPKGWTVYRSEKLPNVYPHL